MKIEVAVLGPRPNEPYGFYGRKATLNHVHALVTVCPEYVNPTSEDIKLHIIIIIIGLPARCYIKREDTNAKQTIFVFTTTQAGLFERM